MTRATLIAGGLLMASIIGVFWPALSGGFVWDDHAVVVRNPNLELSRDALGWMFTTSYMGHFQPLTWLSLAVDRTLWGMDPWGFHLHNLVLHGLCAWLVYALIAEVLLRLDVGQRDGDAEIAEPATSGGRHLWALLGAGLWALHPLRVESVAWVTERRDVLCGVLLLSAVWAYLRASRAGEGARSWRLISLMLYVLSFGAKAWGVSLGVVLLALDGATLRELRWRAALARCAPYLLLGLPFILLAPLSQYDAGAMADVSAHSLYERVAQASYGLLHYPAVSLLPLRLTPLVEIDSGFHRGVGAIWRLVALAAIAGGCLLTLRRWPGLSAAALAYAAIVSPVLGLFQSGSQLVADRYSYFATLPLLVLLLVAVRRSLAPRLLAGLLGLAMIPLALATHLQCGVWMSDMTLWRHALTVDPDGARAHNYLADAYRERGELAQALEHLRRAAQLLPDRTLSHYQLSRVYLLAGMGAEAEASALRATEISPQDPAPRYELAKARWMLGKRERARQDLARALELDQQDTVPGWIRRGRALRETGQPGAAARAFAEAIRLNPFSAEARNERGICRERVNDRRGALADFDLAIRFDPRFTLAYFNRGNLYLRMEDYPRAIADYDSALSIAPRHVGALTNRGRALFLAGRHAEAADSYRRALAARAGAWRAWAGLCQALTAIGQPQAAADARERAVALAPPEMRARLAETLGAR